MSAEQTHRAEDEPPRHPRLSATGRAARIVLAVAACLWLALCTSVGPLYWFDGSIADFGWLNALYFLVSFLGYGAVVLALTRWGAGQPIFGWHRTDLLAEAHEPRRLTPPGLRAWGRLAVGAEHPPGDLRFRSALPAA